MAKLRFESTTNKLVFSQAAGNKLVVECDAVFECDYCTSGTAPESMQVAINGISNGSCSDCTNLEGTYVVPYVGADGACQWTDEFTKTLCSTSQGIVVSVFVNPPTGGNVMLSVTISPQTSGQPQTFRWDSGNTIDIDCQFSAQSVTYESGLTTNCDWTSASITVTAV